MMDYPGKCLSATGNSNEVILADCDQFDANQLFDHTDLLVSFFLFEIPQKKNRDDFTFTFDFISLHSELQYTSRSIEGVGHWKMFDCLIKWSCDTKWLWHHKLGWNVDGCARYPGKKRNFNFFLLKQFCQKYRITAFPPQFGEFKLKASQSPKCITAEENGSFTDITDCFVVVSDSRKRRSLEEPLSRDKRALTTRASIRLSYKMSQPDVRFTL